MNLKSVVFDLEKQQAFLCFVKNKNIVSLLLFL